MAVRHAKTRFFGLFRLIAKFKLVESTCTQLKHSFMHLAGVIFAVFHCLKNELLYGLHLVRNLTRSLVKVMHRIISKNMLTALSGVYKIHSVLE